MALAGNSIMLQTRAPFPTTLKSSKSASKLITFQPKLQSLSHSNVGLSGVSSSSISDDKVGVQQGWSEFGRKVSGEWDGFGADFSSQGKPIELPENVVPEAYREWEVKVFDWQTQCPSLAQSQEFHFMYKTIKLLPTVGCEADAATRHSVDERIVGGGDSEVCGFAYDASGCYVGVWAMRDDGMEVEYCLMHPHDKESRVRIIKFVDSKMRLKNIRVFVEQWYGEFRNGEQLGGCAMRDSAFAATAALQASQVVGAWEGRAKSATFVNISNSFVQELTGDSIRNSVRDEHSLILLPKQLWCSLKAGSHGETISEVGWLFQPQFSLTSTCIFSTHANKKDISIAIAREEIVDKA
ncbi:uncharacterized protein LOC126653819 [Mercurialis annua]|uniref:uncharacterized protein LOC126653819 n=1 Tax=Mercurialis annua TaxID=3986 RepID=UPI00215E453B|nr:uncharacterized protein LOC126653819 [Mercurialis annua]